MLSRKKLCFALAAAFAASSVQAAAFKAQQCAQLRQADSVVSAQWVNAGKLPSDDQAAFTGASRAAADVE